jgi:hypothetical protein
VQISEYVNHAELIAIAMVTIAAEYQKISAKKWWRFTPSLEKNLWIGLRLVEYMRYIGSKEFPAAASLSMSQLLRQ